MKSVLAILSGILSIVILSLYSGFTLTLLWGWFIVPLFGVKALSVANAIGLSIISSFFTRHLLREMIKIDDENYVPQSYYNKLISKSIENSGMITAVLIAGWIVSLFV